MTSADQLRGVQHPYCPVRFLRSQSQDPVVLQAILFVPKASRGSRTHHCSGRQQVRPRVDGDAK